MTHGSYLFREELDAVRCPARVNVGQCGLYHDHDGPHAHSEIASRKPWRVVLHRWDDTGGRWIDDTDPRLAWCAFQHDWPRAHESGLAPPHGCGRVMSEGVAKVVARPRPALRGGGRAAVVVRV